MRIDLDALFGSAPTPYLLLDRDLRIVWMNLTYLEVTGRERDSLIGRLLTEEFPADAGSVSDQMLRRSLSRVLDTGQADHLPFIPYPISAADGLVEDRFWSATHTPILDAGGQVEFILQNTIDVTQLYQGTQKENAVDLPQRAAVLQRAEAVATENLALEIMTEFFQSAFEQAPSFMAILSGPEHVFQVANKAYADLIGGRDVIGLPVRQALPEIEGQGYLELLDQVYRSGKSVSFKAMPALIQAAEDQQPQQHYVDFLFHPIKDKTGAVTGIFVQGHDVTGQKIAETTLTATREKFRTMAQSMPNQVWTADREGGLTWLNNRTYEFTGLSEGQLFGADWTRVVHPDDLGSALETWTAALRDGVSYETEFRIRKADGSFRWHLVRATPLRAEDGTVTGWVGTNTDIEERKNTEAEIAKLNATLESRVAKRNAKLEELHATLRQSQKMEAIGSLAGGIAHDFNNLLQVITGNLQLAARDLPEGSQGQKRLDQAMQSVNRGATLASQLLSFARQQPLAPKVIDLSRLLGDTTDILHSAIGEGVELEVTFADDLWNTSVDPNNLENAVLNLAINARDAMEAQGRLTIDVCNADLDDASAGMHADAAPGQYVTIAVGDDGCGMSAEVIERIFEPFFTTKQDGKGTGLGLSMVYGFARQSGGFVTLDSEVGKGTTVKIYLPRSKEPAQDIHPVETAGMVGGSEIILLVEDDDDVRATSSSMLDELGYTVLEAADAEQALDIVRAGRHIDLLFTDVVMPGRANGRELAETLKEMGSDVPVLFTSGYVQDSIVHDGRLDAGVQLLGKPFTRPELAQKLREVLGCGGVPIHAPTVCNGSAPGKDRPAAEPPFDGLRILVCEDDILIRTDIAEGLRQTGCVVMEAGTAREALALLETEAVDILITDIGLPDQSGEDLARAARETRPALPVIFATGGVDVPAAAALGNCTVLGKPFQDAQLKDAIRSMA